MRRSRKSKRRSRKSRRMRKSYHKRTEVKYTTRYYADMSIMAGDASTSSLKASDYFAIINWPAQGTADGNRIGDQIYTLKVWVKFTISTNQGAWATNIRYASVGFRIIFFTHADWIPANDWDNATGARATPATGVTPATTEFWQRNRPNQVMIGNPNYEVINTILYDKTFYHNPTTVDAISNFVCRKSINFTRKFNKKVVFANGATLFTKDPKNQIYVAVMGIYPPSTTAAPADNTIAGYLNMTVNYYYLDN